MTGSHDGTDASAPESTTWIGRASRRLRSLGRETPLTPRDYRWIGLALLPGLVAVAVYLATNSYPASGAGLYTKIASEIAANGYLLPAEIPGYTADGVPFAYPPLQFYLLAVLLDLGAEPLFVARVLPGVAVLLALVPIYLIGRDVAGSRPVGAVAAASVALNPQLLQWHLTAGGIVRAFSFVYALLAIYAGYRVFAHGSRRAVIVGAVAFGLTVLTHPTYALFAGLTCLLFWAIRDRSVDGFVRGAVMGAGGLLLASPWLGWALSTHGLDVFGAAAGTHGGVGGGLFALFEGVPVYTLVPLLAGAYLAYRRRYLLPTWLVATELVFEQPRFAYTVGAITVPAAGLALLEARGWLPAIDASVRRSNLPSLAGTPVDVRTAGVVALVVVGTVAGGAYLAHEMSLVNDPSTPEYVDDDAVAAMEWVAAETDADATFVVLGDLAEWFPALTDRTVLVAPWGVEWVDAAAFDRQVDAFDRLSACQSVACVESVHADLDLDPDYVYVPKGQYTIRGEYAAQFGTLERSFAATPGWELAYDGDGAAIYRHGPDDTSG